MPTKKSPTKKSPVKKSKKSSKKVTQANMASFHLVKDTPPFLSLRITKQTVYWSVLLVFILITQIWILNVQLDVIQTLDSINAPS